MDLPLKNSLKFWHSTHFQNINLNQFFSNEVSDIFSIFWKGDEPGIKFFSVRLVINIYLLKIWRS